MCGRYICTCVQVYVGARGWCRDALLCHFSTFCCCLEIGSFYLILFFSETRSLIESGVHCSKLAVSPRTHLLLFSSTGLQVQLLGSKLRASCLLSKCFTHWVTSSAPAISLLFVFAVCLNFARWHTYVEARGQLSGVGSFLSPSGSQGWNSGCQLGGRCLYPLHTAAACYLSYLSETGVLCVALAPVIFLII